MTFLGICLFVYLFYFTVLLIVSFIKTVLAFKMESQVPAQNA